nr:hypothetical protein [Burkholderia pseudomallei]
MYSAQRGAVALIGLAGRVGKTSVGAAGWNSPRRFCRAASVAPRSALEAFTGTSPIQMTAPLPLRSYRKPCACRRACSSAQLEASRMIGAAASMAMRSADCSPVRTSMSRRF